MIISDKNKFLSKITVLKLIRQKWLNEKKEKVLMKKQKSFNEKVRKF